MVQAARGNAQHKKDEYEYVHIPPYRELTFIDPLMIQRDEAPQNWQLRD